jgi:hypothetical protein
MTPLDTYFTEQYIPRLEGLKEKIGFRTPVPGSPEDIVLEFAGWVQKELDFFYAGTHEQLKLIVGDLTKLINKNHKLLTSVEFINHFLLGLVTADWIKQLITGKVTVQ